MLVENIIEVVIFYWHQSQWLLQERWKWIETLATETKEDSKDMIRVFVRFSFKDWKRLLLDSEHVLHISYIKILRLI